MATTRSTPSTGYGFYKGTNIPITNTRGGSTSLQSMTEEANVANKKREEEIRTMYDQIIGMYQPGGGYGAGTEAMLERQKAKDVASATSSLISSGLYGTTVTAGLPKKWEEEVGMPSRLKLEDMRYGALTSAMQDKAKFIENIQNMFPDYGMMAQWISQQNAAPTNTWTSAGEFGRGVHAGASGIR